MFTAVNTSINKPGQGTFDSTKVNKLSELSIFTLPVSLQVAVKTQNFKSDFSFCHVVIVVSWERRSSSQCESGRRSSDGDQKRFIQHLTSYLISLKVQNQVIKAKE